MTVAASIRHYNFYRQLDSLFGGIRNTNSARYEAQDISGLEYSITKSKSNEINNQLIVAKSEVEQSIIKFNKWLPNDVMYVPNAESSIKLLDKVQFEMNSSHPYLEYYKQNIAVSESRLDMSYSQLYPKISGNYAIQSIQGQSGFYSYQVG